MIYHRIMQNYVQRIEDALKAYLTPAQALSYSKIYESAAYSACAGGKRIRPVIVLAMCALHGGDVEAALPLACALEMVHTYSLVHDDLPCMDNDDLRRGKPTNHKVYGEAMAVLTGDALLSKAFSIVADAQTLSERDRLRSVSYLAHAAGMDGMIGGQVLDIYAENQTIDLNTLIQLQQLKTGKLLCAASVLGCYAAGVTDNNALACAESYGNNLGAAFQIQDDILDVEGNQATLGKTTGKDAKSGKSTFVSLLGLQACKERVLVLTHAALATLPSTNDAAFLQTLAQELIHRTY